MNKIDRFFYIPEECVEDVTEKALEARKTFQNKVAAFLKKIGTELCSERRDGGIYEIAFFAAQLSPKGLRFTHMDNYKGESVNMVVPDLRTKEGRAFEKEIFEINTNAVPAHVAINEVAKKYGLNIERVIQENHMRSFGGNYCPHVGAYLLQVPATGDRALSPDYVVPPEITEITESQFIAITKENGKLGLDRNSVQAEKIEEAQETEE